MNNTEFITKAISFAAKAHEQKNRKGTTVPYITHPVEAMGIVSSLTSDPEVIAAAVLHDVIEDSPVTAAELQEFFGSRVADLVCSESEDKMNDIPAEASWKTRKEATIVHLAACTDSDVKLIALGDKLSNLRCIERDLAEIGPAFWNRFNQNDPLLHKWYYSSILSALGEFEDTPAYREYQRLMEKIW